jgi:hypothetical protein
LKSVPISIAKSINDFLDSPRSFKMDPGSISSGIKRLDLPLACMYSLPVIVT